MNMPWMMLTTTVRTRPDTGMAMAAIRMGISARIVSQKRHGDQGIDCVRPAPSTGGQHGHDVIFLMVSLRIVRPPLPSFRPWSRGDRGLESRKQIAAHSRPLTMVKGRLKMSRHSSRSPRGGWSDGPHDQLHWPKGSGVGGIDQEVASGTRQTHGHRPGQRAKDAPCFLENL